MAVLPPIAITLPFVAFVANLIELKQFSTVLVLQDQTTKYQVDMLIDTLSSRSDVAWLIVNVFNSPKFWNNITINQNQNQLILTMLTSKNIYFALSYLYNKKILNKRSKNLIVLNDDLKKALQIFCHIFAGGFNVVLGDWTSDEAVIYVWNPYSLEPVKISDAEFLRTSRSNLTSEKYSGIFFDQLQNKKGRTSFAMVVYGGQTTYNVVSKGSEVSIDGVDIQLIDLIGELIQSPIEYLVLKPSTVQSLNGNTRFYEDFLERNYTTYASIQRKNYRIVTHKQ